MTVAAQPAESSDAIDRNEVRVTQTMLYIIGTFMICWIPLGVNFVCQLLSYQSTSSEYNTEEGQRSHLIDFLTYCAIHLNSAIDPLIYAYRIKSVRNAIKNTLNCFKIPLAQEQSSYELSTTRDGSKNVEK